MIELGQMTMTRSLYEDSVHLRDLVHHELGNAFTRLGLSPEARFVFDLLEYGSCESGSADVAARLAESRGRCDRCAECGAEDDEVGGWTSDGRRHPWDRPIDLPFA